MDRDVVRQTTIDEVDDGFVPGTMRERMEMVWDITVALWAVATNGEIHAESRLQRDVALLERGRG
jgi:hypothetical protein